jgi:carboxylate-amine ligase
MLDFKRSDPLTLGIELELQLINRRDYNLTRAASDLLTRLKLLDHGFDIKPEITESMIEVATSIHRDVNSARSELIAIRNLLVTNADQMNIAISGGGAHPFQHWYDQRIFKADRYRLVSDLYGYLAKQFTVYGQHIHIGCPNGDVAIQLANFLAKYLPDFIALSASSPYYQGIDTAFQSSRLTSVNAFPLSGKMPGFRDWEEFSKYFESMKSMGIVESMKDFYWDIRPKPEFGTIELRVCDSPIHLRTALAIAAYAQALSAACFQMGETNKSPNVNLDKVHSYNRFQACRFGLSGSVVDPDTCQISPLKTRILDTLERVRPFALKLDSGWAIDWLELRVQTGTEDAAWMRETFIRSASLSEVVRSSSIEWASGRVE